MKVLIIHTSYTERGGEDIVFEMESRLLKEYGFNVKKILFNNKKYKILKLFFLLFNPISFIKVLKAIRTFHPDIIHVHNWYFGASPSIFIAAKLMKIPVVHTIHNFRILCPSGTLYNNGRLYFDSIDKLFPIKCIYKKVYKNSIILTFWLLLCTRFHYLIKTWSNIDKIICLTLSSKELFIKSYLKFNENKIIIKPNFTEYNITDIQSERKNHFLYVGRLTEDKGVTLILNSFLKSTNKLKIIGAGPLQKEVEIITSQNSNIQFLYFLKKSEILSELKNCKALIFPSICFEPFGLVIIEAFACGTPVIGTEIGGPKDIIKDNYNGFFFKPNHQQDLEDKLHTILNCSTKDYNILQKNAIQSYQSLYNPMYTLNILSINYQLLKEQGSK